MPQACEVIVDIAHANVDRLFTYLLPEGLTLPAGSHVLVPFGSGNRPREGFAIRVFEYIAESAESAPEQTAVTLKTVLRLLEPYPILTQEQIELAYWMQKSYHCLLVDALRLMIPSQIRGGKVKEKIERTVHLRDVDQAETMLASLLDKSGKARSPKQYEVLELLLKAKTEFSVSDIAAYIPGASGAISALIKRGYLVEGGHVTFRRPDLTALSPDKHVLLSPSQQQAVEAIANAQAARQGTLLLHGVTGSGKTEVYMHAIERCLALGRQAIMLVPEISLTPQTVGLFRERFGDEIAVLHSRLSAGERFDEWRRIRLGKARVAVGARSAVFAPMENVGLILVDEEHEPSYFSEVTPRYHALEVAAHRAKAFGAPLVLGSATPSLLTYYRAQSGRYQLLELPERVQNRPLPSVEIVDMREEFQAGNNGIFSGRLVQLLGECVEQNRQAMLFLNRRGYSTFVSCRSCGYVILCDNCDISMTYHKGENRLRCHFCGAVKPLPTKCPQCGKAFIKYFGIGTEQVEEQLNALFPGTVTLRMDTDTVRTKDSMQQMLGAFARGEAQFLVGTQMIAKGHDFPNVILVGVVAADATLMIPDYRSTERTFQLLTQVAGRAGRDENPGRVVIQTYSPAHPAIRFAKTHDYKNFYHYELEQRKKAVFPPFSLFIRILFSGEDEAALQQSVTQYAEELQKALSERLGEHAEKDILLYSASPAPIKRKQCEYRYQILIKLLRTARLSDAIQTIYTFAGDHRSELFAMVEVNPQDML
ncbi:MAG TPA: primosomal protein N' [Candidatus Cryosericum sp.]|nr:primosomal protein N' [Candidatus Cryosericum sp.]